MASDRKLRPRAQPASAKPINRPRPSRILNTGKKALLSNATAQSNSTQSPLLSLPPEIRNRIYGYVLGGQTIHVCVDSKWDWESKTVKYRIGHSVCCSKVSDEEAAQAIRYADDLTDVPKFATRHEQCHLNIDKRDKRRHLHLSLLQICSQIHREAALVPFQDNTFTITWNGDSSVFFKRLVPRQLRAITSLNVYGQCGFFPSVPKPVVTGLTKVTAILMMGSSREERAREFQDDAKKLRVYFSIWSGVDLATAHATVCFLPSIPGELSDRTDPALRSLSDLVEKAMREAV
ncbi:hypothetical protein LTR85_000161 [Meristemomyces frigidus]|nr:hypothetical protein LTR85_000161 [Meristemomyces frigidus]